MNGVKMYSSDVHGERKEEVLYREVSIRKEKGQEYGH